MDTPTVVRYPRGKGTGVEVTADAETVEVGKARVLRRGKGRVAFVGFGPMTHMLAEVAGHLDGTLLDMRFVKPLDREALLEAAKAHDLVVVAEDSVLDGGAGSAVLEVLSEAGLSVPVMRFGLPDRFIEQGTQAELHEELGLTAAAVEEKVKARLATMKKSPFGGLFGR